MFMDDADDTFHRGERLVQERVGVAARMQVAGRAIRGYMSEQHRDFFEQLPFVVVGSVDASGQPWASIVAGPPGFMAASADLLTIGALPLAGDPLVVRPGALVGLLGIEPHTRRRNRMNGVVESVDAQGFCVRVQQSFGNCPKYIQAREPSYVPRAPGTVVRSAALDDFAVRMLLAADTFFIASAYPGGGEGRSHGVDVSHRGGNPGFISVSDGALRVPDYSGNNYFNTLGNLAINSRAGLLVVDFVTGDLLFVAVTVEIVWSGAEVEAVPGAKRLLVMEVVRVVRLEGALGLRWTFGAAKS
jgi:predicted pyridoxine 5'-phosphate oxidase superfamily flavin-nucleotide-binding protein